MKFRGKKNKTTAGASSVPAIYFTQRSARQLREFTDGLQERIAEGRLYFLLELAGVMIRTVKALAPEIKVGDEMVDYARGLRLALITGLDEMDALCIYHEGIKAEVTEKDAASMALYIRPHMGAPAWVGVLMAYGPWPGDLLPVRVTTKEARIVSRTARPDELVALRKRILERRMEIVEALNAGGAQEVTLEPNGNAIGLEVHEDMGWSVMRAEFGFGETAAKAHWRPAIREVTARARKVFEKYHAFVMTGRNLFDLAETEGEVSAHEADRLAKSGHFMLELAPFIPKG